MLLGLLRTKLTPKWAHTRLCPALGTAPELMISPRERGPASPPLWEQRDTGPKHTKPDPPRNYNKGIPARGSCCCLCLWLKIFLVIFLSLPCFPHSDKHPNKATTSSNCPGISIASSLHDLSTFNSNFILTVPKIAKEYRDATPQLRNTD